MVFKCLSLKQPFAELLVSGMKTIEVRKWKTKRLKIDQAKLVTGAVVGKASLYDVISYRSKILS